MASPLTVSFFAFVGGVIAPEGLEGVETLDQIARGDVSAVTPFRSDSLLVRPHAGVRMGPWGVFGAFAWTFILDLVRHRTRLQMWTRNQFVTLHGVLEMCVGKGASKIRLRCPIEGTILRNS